MTGIITKNTKDKPRSFFDNIDSWSKQQGASGLAYFTIEKDKELISIPYPLKTMMWDKLFKKIQEGQVKKPEDLKKWLNTYPMKVDNPNSIMLDDGVMEVTHSPTGCMLIKRSVFEKMIKAYPQKAIVQKTVINGEYVDRPNMWNFLIVFMILKLKHI